MYKTDSKTFSKTDSKTPESPDGDSLPPENSLLAKTQSEYPDAAIASRSGKALRWGTGRDVELAQLIARQVALVTLDDKPMTNAALANWANDIRLMREQDKRTHEQIWALFDWAQHETGWGKWRENILSPAAIRKNWGKLAAGFNSERQQGGRKKPTDADDWGDGINDL